ncbi:MAG: serine hydrolase [Christensenellales bacterium]|jgi:CubicO group peptidase (beta-lactamase class C family)
MEQKPMPRSTPEREGVPTKAIERYMRAIQAQKLAMHSVMMVRNGKIIYEAYYKPFDADFRHRLYSCSKSFTAVAIGILAEQGRLHLDDRCLDYFPDKAGADAHPYLAQLTIRDLLRMASPYTQGANYSPSDPVWEDTFFTDEVSHVPGSVYSYCTSGTTMLCAIIRRVTGENYLDVLRPVFDKIGVSRDIFSVETPEGIEWGGSGVCATPREFAKFANLCMRYGAYEGEQLLPRDYMIEATSRQIDNSLYAASIDKSQGYGYQFWVLQDGGFGFFGMGGQFALCFPKQDFMIVTTGYEELMSVGRAEIFRALWRELMPALRDAPLPEDERAQADLAALTQGLALVHAEGAADSPIAAKVSGQTYAMRENAMGMRRVRFDFADGAGTMTYENATGKHALRFGMLHNIKQEFPERYWGRRIGVRAEKGYESYVSAAWTMPDSLRIDCHIADIHLGQLRLVAAFKDGTLTLHGLKHAEWFLDEFAGFASGERAGDAEAL